MAARSGTKKLLMVWSISSIGRMFAKYTLQKKIMDKLNIVYIFAQGMFSANQTAWLKIFRMHKLLIKMQMIYIYIYMTWTKYSKQISLVSGMIHTWFTSDMGHAQIRCMLQIYHLHECNIIFESLHFANLVKFLNQFLKVPKVILDHKNNSLGRPNFIITYIIWKQNIYHMKCLDLNFCRHNNYFLLTWVRLYRV